MSGRRDFMSYVGTAAIGGIVGYYTGAKELLGLQSTAQGPTGATETSPTATPAGAATETEAPGTEAPPTEEGPADALFRDGFDDGTFEDQWQYIEGERHDDTEVTESGTTLRHDSPKNYGPNEPIETRQSFDASGTHRVTMRVRTNGLNYWGFGIGIKGEQHGVALKNHKWEGFDRFAVFGVTDRPDEYASDYDVYGEQTRKAKLAAATATTSFQTYSMTVDFDSNTVTRVQRGDETWDLSLPTGDIGSMYRLRLPTGGGHDVEYDSIAVTAVDR